jgi:pimeloyl-ACP methyl ester carboxylesterase
MLAALLAWGAGAAERPVPSQADWDAARQTVETADGLALTYVEMGPETGVPVLLLHGYTDNSRSWSLMAPHLPGRRLIALDLRGHGRSEAPACCYGIDSLAHDVLGFMDAKGIGQADLVGHSLGSITAAVIAALEPARVRRLVLVSTAAAAPKGIMDWLWSNVPGLPRPIDPESQFMKDWYWNPNPVPDDFISRMRAESAAAPEQAWMGVLAALTLTDWAPLAPRIAAPVLILWGDQDQMFLAPEQERVRSLLPAARHETFAGYGHNMFWEAPERAGALIASFLSQ